MYYCIVNLFLFLAGTATATALSYTAQYAFQPDFGARSEVENKLVIFVTDGRTSLEERPYLSVSIERLKNIATKVIFLF